MKNIGRNNLLHSSVRLVEKQDELFWPGDSHYPAIIPLKPTTPSTALTVVNYFKPQDSGVGAGITVNIASKTNDLIVIEASYPDNAEATAWTISNTGSSITWTKKIETNAAGNCKVVVWTGKAGIIPPQSITVTTTAGSSTTGAKVVNVDVATNAGNDIVNMFSGTAATDVSQALTPTTSTSSIRLFLGDWAETNSAAPGANTQLMNSVTQSGFQSVALFRTIPDPLTSNSPVTISENDTGGLISWAVFEIPAAGAGAQTGLCTLVTKIASKANTSTFSKSNGATNTQSASAKNSTASLKSLGSSSSSTAIGHKSVVQSAKIGIFSVVERMKFLSLGVSTHLSIATVSERASLSSQISFLKIGSASAFEKVVEQNSSGTIKTGIGQAIEKFLSSFSNLASAAGVSGSGFAVTASRVLNSLSSTKIGAATELLKLVNRETTTGIKIELSSIVTKSPLKIFDSYAKSSVVNIQEAARLRNSESFAKISQSSLSTLLNLKGQPASIKQSTSSVISLIEIKSQSSAGKVVVVVVSSGSIAIALRGATQTSKFSQSISLQQIPISEIAGYTKIAIGALFNQLNIVQSNSGLPSASVVFTCPEPSMDLTIIPFGSRFENEAISGELCGGENRFTFELSNLLGELKKRNLL